VGLQPASPVTLTSGDEVTGLLAEAGSPPPMGQNDDLGPTALSSVTLLFFSHGFEQGPDGDRMSSETQAHLWNVGMAPAGQ
jgi:hypothetical protein